MITVKNVKMLDGQTATLKLNSSNEHVLEADGLLCLPGLIDSHISCGSPEEKNWLFTVESAIRGGVTSMIDIPSKAFQCETKDELEFKSQLVKKRLSELHIPLGYYLYGKGNSDRMDEIALEKKLIIGSILLLTPEDYDLKDQYWDRIFQLAAWEDLPVVINSRNENAWRHPMAKPSDETMLEKAFRYAEKQNTRLYVLNVATQKEIDLLGDARRRSLLLYAETTPQHLFPQDGSNANFLWDALNKGIIETVGSGYHADMVSNERVALQGEQLDFLNPNLLLPLLLTAHHEGKVTLETIVRLTRVNLFDVFKIERKDQDIVLIDLNKEKTLERTYQGNKRQMKLKGWPVYTIIKGEIFSCSAHHHLDRIG